MVATEHAAMTAGAAVVPFAATTAPLACFAYHHRGSASVFHGDFAEYTQRDQNNFWIEGKLVLLTLTFILRRYFYTSYT